MNFSVDQEEFEEKVGVQNQAVRNQMAEENEA